MNNFILSRIISSFPANIFSPKCCLYPSGKKASVVRKFNMTMKQPRFLSFYAPHRKISGILFYHCLSVRPSLRPFVCTKVKIICKSQGQISRSCFSKDGCFCGLSVSQTHLVHLKNSSNDQEKPSPSTLGENTDACSLSIF